MPGSVLWHAGLCPACGSGLGQMSPSHACSDYARHPQEPLWARDSSVDAAEDGRERSWSQVSADPGTTTVISWSVADSGHSFCTGVSAQGFITKTDQLQVNMVLAAETSWGALGASWWVV